MKTNQLMLVSMFDSVLHIEHKTGMGSLTDVFTIGNNLRISDGKKLSQLTAFLNSAATQEYIEAVKKEWLLEEAYYIKGRGNQKVTMAHISLLVYAAEYLSPTFHAKVVKEFIHNRILDARDESGDLFNALNFTVDHCLPNREGKDNKGIYIYLASAIKEKVRPNGASWNTASAQQLRERSILESKITDFLKMGFIKDWDHLKGVIEKL